MGRIKKTLALSLTLIITLSCLTLLVVKPASAQTTPYPEMPKPAVPQFTVKLIDSSYDIPASTSTDPYTGQTITHPSQHVEARTIEIRIKNEPFTPFVVQEGTDNWTVNYFYNIRWKGHFENDWHELFLADDGYLSRDSSGSETVFAPQGTYSSTNGLKMSTQGMYSTFPPNSKLDFQVEAMIGYTHRVLEGDWAPWYFFGENSSWSSTQTLTIPSSSLSPAPSPSTTATVPEISWLVIVPLLLSMLSVAVVFRHRKTC